VAPASRFALQVGAFAVQENAYALKRQLDARYEGVFVSTYKTPNRTYYRVRIGAKDRDAALRMARRLVDEGYPVILIEE
jgi:cell division protein FtsN